jgi:hypothetical protein
MSDTAPDVTYVFPLVPSELSAGWVVRVGSAGALYQVLEVAHGAPAPTRYLSVAWVPPQIPRDYTADTFVRLRPVAPHDVPWDAQIIDLYVDDETSQPAG